MNKVKVMEGKVATSSTGVIFFAFVYLMATVRQYGRLLVVVARETLTNSLIPAVPS